ncbi:MAG: glycosyltransferase [Bacteroidia bacterium]|nr:glycosyltransferase [Bacteroidia bacterium]
MERHLHIVAFDVPFPANYGGAIDLFYKLKAFAELGIKVTLHCFEYGRGEALELNKYCKKVYYYKRQNSRQYLLSFNPFIVVSRSSPQLLVNLCKDKSPILFEGLHCCYYLNHEKLKGRRRVVRTHNVEHDYYRHLAAAESSVFKRFYFELEANKLKTYETELTGADALVAISPADTSHFSKLNSNTFHITAFHTNSELLVKPGKGSYCLYHGSLGIGENNKAALWLVNEVFSKLNTPLIIAGNNASIELKTAISKFPHISLRTEITTEEIHQLIQDAQLNVIPTFQATGIKLKLLAALYNGRACVVNLPMVENTGLESLCLIAKTANEMVEIITKQFEQPFETKQLEERRRILLNYFDNQKNAEKFIQILFP